jgi:hypothetical protein
MNKGMNVEKNTPKTAKNRKKTRLLNKIQQPLTICRSPFTVKRFDWDSQNVLRKYEIFST